MSFTNLDFFSQTLEMSTHCNVILPHDITKSDKPAKVLYLLHGLSDDCSKWTRFTNLERLVNGKHIAVVMPEVHRSFYTDMRYGIKYFQYIAFELPDICRRMMNISAKREDTYIAGLSMGGYGALKTALTRPDVFSKVASFSGVTNFKRDLEDQNGRYRKDDNIIKQFIAIAGKELKLTDDEDTWVLAERALKSENPPEILLTCGTEDYLYQSNVEFKNHLDKIGYDAKFIEWQGCHGWKFWEESLPHLLEFLEV